MTTSFYMNRGNLPHGTMDGMESTEYDLMFRIEQSYWWFVSRRRLVVRLLRRWLRATGPVTLLDMGCGTGANLLALREFGPASGCDIAAAAVEYCHGRGLADVVQQTDLTRLPFSGDRFDLVTGLDVVEHIEDDRGMMREILRILKPGGAVFLTVPAYPALWSVHDESMHHKRRYTRRTMTAALTDAGFRVEHVTHFNLLLLPAILPVRWLRDRLTRSRGTTSDFNLDLHPVLNTLFRWIFFSEWAVLRFVPLPAGLSLVVLARKPGG